MAEPGGADRGSRPTPDPTVLTTEQLLREVDRVKELMEARLHGVEEIIGEKFRSVDRQLILAEQQRVEQKADTKAAVDAALTAQKEAVREQTTASELSIAKSDAATTRQLEQLSATFTTAINGVTNILDDLKDRVGKIEYVRQGQAESRTESREERTEGREVVSMTTAVFGAIVALVVILLALYAATRNSSSPTGLDLITFLIG